LNCGSNGEDGVAPGRARALPRDRWAEGETMLWIVFVILLVLWLLGLATAYTLGGFIHMLLLVAIAVLLTQLIMGRRVV
jgi:hypothetical protein